jgi:hypothetical protein
MKCNFIIGSDGPVVFGKNTDCRIGTLLQITVTSAQVKYGHVNILIAFRLSVVQQNLASGFL